ncbi:MAG: DUF1275 domain-containing protein [Gammaproteobacteria bacterium]|nr:DUF1275 domain-containing protein [Gammaproteobacteria bacterium]
MLKFLADKATLLFLLSMTAGAVDTIGFLALGGLFAAHITGNIVILAAHFVTGKFSQTGPLLAVPVFMIVLGIVTLIAGRMERAGFSLLSPLLVLQLLLLFGALLLGITLGPFKNIDGLAAVSTGMFAVAAMAAQSATVKLALKKAPSTVAMTNNITQLTLDLARLVRWRQGTLDEMTAAQHQAKVTLMSILGFILGCGMGAILQNQFDFFALFFPFVLALFALFLPRSY